MFRTSLSRRDWAYMDSPHSPISSTLGGASLLKLPPGFRSMVSPSRFSVGMNLMSWLSVTIRTARLSTSGGLEASACACATREVPTKVPINAATKPPPPAHSKPRRDTEEAVGRQLHVPNSMSRPSALFRWRQSLGSQLRNNPADGDNFIEGGLNSAMGRLETNWQ